MIYVGYHSTNKIEDGYFGSGKIIKRAIAKNGIENFKKEIIHIFDNKEEAEAKEAEIVNKDFCERTDTYNIALGGNVRSYPGKNNPMYGLRHSEELLEQISESRKKTIDTRGYGRKTKYECIINGITYYSSYQAKKDVGISRDSLLIIFCGNPENEAYFVDNEFQKEAEQKFLEDIEHKKLMSKENSDRAKARFSGVCKSEEHKEKIGAGHRGSIKPWVSEKINKNPEKIRKMAESHTGMKRSPEARENIRNGIIEARRKKKLKEETNAKISEE